MTRYLVSIYQPDTAPPPPEVLDPIMADVAAVNEELRASGSWVFAAGLHRLHGQQRAPIWWATSCASRRSGWGGCSSS